MSRNVFAMSLGDIKLTEIITLHTTFICVTYDKTGCFLRLLVDNLIPSKEAPSI
jgi:hypothetical protein